MVCWESCQRAAKSQADKKQMDEIEWVKENAANYLSVCVCAMRDNILYVGDQRKGESMQDGGSSSLTGCSAVFSQFIAVIPYFFWHFQLCLSHMAGHWVFFYALLITLLCFSLPFPLPCLILFLHLIHSISFLSGCSFLVFYLFFFSF